MKISNVHLLFWSSHSLTLHPDFFSMVNMMILLFSLLLIKKLLVLSLPINLLLLLEMEVIIVIVELQWVKDLHHLIFVCFSLPFRSSRTLYNFGALRSSVYFGLGSAGGRAVSSSLCPVHLEAVFFGIDRRSWLSYLLIGVVSQEGAT
jgi:hypothetical protein